jgi:uncharacterized membrane protein
MSRIEPERIGEDDVTHLPPAARKNIEIIAQVEQQLLRERSMQERAGESIARFFGSLLFIVAHGLFFTWWILLNTRIIPGPRPFDPYPFALLALIIGIEFIFLTTFVLINQKHQMRRTEQWSHLHLQLSMLTEQEVTKTMQMVAELHHGHGLAPPAGDKELEELTKPTSVTAVLGHLEKTRDEVGESSQTLEQVRDLEVELLKKTEHTE